MYHFVRLFFMPFYKNEVLKSINKKGSYEQTIGTKTSMTEMRPMKTILEERRENTTIQNKTPLKVVKECTNSLKSRCKSIFYCS